MCDVIKIRVKSISFLEVSFPTSLVHPPFYACFYDVKLDTFQRFQLFCFFPFLISNISSPPLLSYGILTDRQIGLEEAA